MKIVHASNFTIRWNGEGYYTIPYKLSSGLTRAGHFVFNYCDQDVARAHPLRWRKLGEGRANDKLIDICREVRPDLLLLGHCTLIHTDTVRAIREQHPQLRIAHWNCDGLFVPSNLARLQALAPIVDASFVTTAGDALAPVVRDGGRVCFMPNPVDRSVESLKVFESENLPNDLVFLTGFDAFDAEKREICNAIRSRLPNLKFDVRGLFGNPGVYGAKMFDVLAQAKMGLNLSKRSDVRLYSSDRMSQLMGCGLLSFIDRRTGFGEIFGPDELVTYGDIDELVQRIDYYRAHDAERRNIAERGWRRAHAIFNETLVAQWIVDVTFDRPRSHAYAWPTEVLSAGR
jgi:hypothetical protein